MAEDKQTPEEEVEETVETPDVDTETTEAVEIDPMVAMEAKVVTPL